MRGLISEAVGARACPNEAAEFLSAANVMFEISVARQSSVGTLGVGVLDRLETRLGYYSPVVEPCGFEGEVDLRLEGTVETWTCPRCGRENQRDTGDDADDDD